MSQKSYLEVHLLISAYKRLLSLINCKRDKRLEELANFLDSSLTHISLILIYEVDMTTGTEMVKGLREGLRNFPALVMSVVPGYCSAFIEELENNLGYSFASFAMNAATEEA